MVKIFILIIIFCLLLSPVKASQNVLVKITDAGFQPQSFALNKGQSVIFLNEDLSNHWPASNIHPTHGIYPEFDPKKEISPGQSWQFRFEKVGTFRFHDHIYPALSGVIKVEGENLKTPRFNLQNLKSSLETFLKKTYFIVFPGALKQELDSLDSIKASTDGEKLTYWISLIGGKKYMEELVKDSGGGSKIDCHQEAHLVGRKSYELEGKQVFKKLDYNCHSGYLHGALEAFMSYLEGKDLTVEVEKLCIGFPTSFSKFECLHGIGHGLTAYADYDLPEALSLCRKLSTEYTQTSCFGGVFMENIMVAEGRGAVKGHQTKWVSSDPHFPCSGIDKDYNTQYHCYQMQTSRMLQLFPKDYAFLEAECLKAPEDMVEICFRSMGRDVAGQTLRDPQKILEICEGVPPQYFKACIKGALNVIIDFWGENIKDQPQKLCKILNERSSSSNKDDKSSCFGLLGDRLKGIFESNKGKINEICSKVEKEYVNFCLNGSTQT